MKDTYIAIKVEGLNPWLWFKKSYVTEENGIFKGVTGWGKNGTATSIEINSEYIKGRIESDSLQYT